MTGRWDALNARARGLRTHSLTRGDLERLTEAPDLPALADALRAAGFPVTDADRFDPAALELAVRRRAASQLATLSRWAGPHAAATAMLYDEEEHRSLRALLRGAVEGADRAQRLAGTVPTPSLPERALEELARQPSPRAIAALLSAWRHPCGPPLLAALGAGDADLFRLELALGRHFAARALRLAGHGALLAYVRQAIDVANTLAAIVMAERPADLTPKEAFLTGGERITIVAFEEAVQTGSGGGAAARLAREFGATPLGGPLSRSAGDAAGTETVLLHARLAEQRRAARHDPLGPAPLLAFVLGLRAETADLRRIIWGLALGAPRARLAAELATVA